MYEFEPSSFEHIHGIFMSGYANTMPALYAFHIGNSNVLGIHHQTTKQPRFLRVSNGPREALDAH